MTTPKAVQPLPEQRTHAERVALLDFDFAQLSQWLAQFQVPPFRARQIWEWIYQRYAEDFAEMSDLPKTLREQLAAQRARVAIGQSRRPAIQADGVKYHSATSPTPPSPDPIQSRITLFSFRSGRRSCSCTCTCTTY